MFDCRRDISSISHRDVSPVSPFAVLSFSLADEILQKYSMQAEGYYPFGTTTFLEERETEESANPPKEKRPESPDININLELFLMLSDPYVSAEEKNKILSVSDKAGLVYGGQRLRIIERAAALRKTQFGRRHEVRIRQKIPVPYVPITKASSSFGKGDISRIKYPAMVFSEVIDKAQNAGVTFGGSGTGKVPVPVYIKDFEKNNRPYDIWEELPEEAATSEKAVVDNTYKDVPEMITDTEVGIPVFDTVTESILPGTEIIHVKDNAESAEAEYRQLTPGKTGRTLGKLVGDLFGNLASLIRIESVNGKASQRKDSERPLSAEKDILQEKPQKEHIRTATAGKQAAVSMDMADSAENQPIKPVTTATIGNETIKPTAETAIENQPVKPEAAAVTRPIKSEDAESIIENPAVVITAAQQGIQESAPEGLLPGAEIIYVKENAEAAEAENSLTSSGNADRYIRELTEDVASLIQKESIDSKALQTGKTAGSFGVDKKHRMEESATAEAPVGIQVEKPASIEEERIPELMIPESVKPESMLPGAEIIYAEAGTETMKTPEEAEAGKSSAMADRVFEKLAESISKERIFPGSEQQPGQNQGKVWSTGQIPETVAPGAEIIYEKVRGIPEEGKAGYSQEEQEPISILTKSIVKAVRSTAGMRFLQEEIGRRSIRTGRAAGNIAAKTVRSMTAPISAAESYTDSITGETLSDITVSPFLTGKGQPLTFEETAYSPYGAVNIEYADTVANLSREIQNAVNAGSFQRQNGAGFIDPGNIEDSFDPFEISSTASFAEEVRKELLSQGPSVTYQNPYFMGAGSEMTHRERQKDSEQTPENQGYRQQQSVRISDAELRRSADKIFNMIKDKVKLERRSMGLS